MPSCSWHTLIPQIGNFSQLIEDWFVLAAQMGSTKMNAAAVIIRLNPTSVSLARPFCGVENKVPQLAFEFLHGWLGLSIPRVQVTVSVVIL